MGGNAESSTKSVEVGICKDGASNFSLRYPTDSFFMQSPYYLYGDWSLYLYPCHDVMETLV